ncbi:nicotinamide mononucleotide transporter [Listeria grandensis]|uniref:Nicotinamide mononucleotide transporter n=1 Tax=Listeria grandensis TaxID=1494963 RepID=A0A7X0Y1N9_9LIST|nr:nicotinamide riboside transporter PnuC [Listeria grandensis]MBC1935371.1 nicotinamide mononucleotide transporter [Listeria grandensis]
MKSVIMKIGRNKLYPYICVLLVTIAFLATNPLVHFEWRYLLSYIGAICGLICVILLAKGKNSGNIFGMLAAFGEMSGNFLGRNVGAALPSLYYFVTHIFGLVTWRKHLDREATLEPRKLTERHFGIAVIFIIVASFVNMYLTGILGVANDPYQLMLNNFIFALGVTAQFLMIARFSFNWYLWIIMNILVISLNIYTKNPIIATQYAIYLFNAVYGLLEWHESENRKGKLADVQ